MHTKLGFLVGLLAYGMAALMGQRFFEFVTQLRLVDSLMLRVTKSSPNYGHDCNRLQYHVLIGAASIFTLMSVFDGFLFAV